MTGESDLRTLLAGMAPRLHPDLYVFATLPPGQPVPPGADPRMTFREEEGTSLILTAAAAQAVGIPGSFPCRMITLEIHSALAAVGFLAAIIPALAHAGMGVNPVAAFHHDHLFIPADRANDAMVILRRIAGEAGGSSSPVTPSQHL
ncbi:MAG: hypothetical protein RLY86_229 [Pseudomonadota bacterium]|jgi:hypothetical protein